MTDAGKAVFLSYASQDADAARRIAEALRSAEVEVWFDVQGGLEHGDEWDAKIRRQIKECLLFVPLISANTQARLEGYFRIEWDLAAERARGIASGVPFILPVVIDDTREPDAFVPDRFRMVQWTTLPDGVVPAEVLQRFLQLWLRRKGIVSNRTAHSDSAAVAPTNAPVASGRRPVWLVPALSVVLAVAALAIWRPWRQTESKAPESGSTSSVSEAHQLNGSPTVRDWPKQPDLKQAMSLLDGTEAIPEDFRLAEEIVQGVLDASPMDPEANVAMARVQSMWLLRGWDRSDERYVKAKASAERALQLSPNQPEALAALAIYTFIRDSLSQGQQLPRALELARKAVELEPGEPRFHRIRDSILFFLPDVSKAEALASSERTVELFPKDPLVHYELARRYRDAGRWEDFDREADAAIALGPVANAIVWKARVEFGIRGDLKAMKALLDQVPPRMQSVERTVFGYFIYAVMSGHYADGVNAVQLMPEPWMIDFDYRGPRTLLLAELLELQGKHELARLQYEDALTEVKRHQADASGDVMLRVDEAWILHGLGRDDEARAVNRVSNEVIERPYRINPLTSWWFFPIPHNLLLGDRTTALDLIREAATTPEGRSTTRQRMRLDPRMKPFREDPEIQALLTEPEVGAEP